MIERINPFQHGAFGHYSQGVKIDLGPKTTVLVVGQIALNDKQNNPPIRILSSKFTKNPT
jgi:hypothetical protein